MMRGLGGGSLGTLFITLTANPAALINGMNQAVKSVEGGSARILDKLTRMSVSFAAVLGGAAVKAAADFEESFAGVRKTLDATENEFKRLEGAFRGMAKQIPVSVNEINRVAEAAGQLGIKNENILGFTRTMVDMAVAVRMSSDEAATQLARIATLTQMPQENFGRLASTIVDLDVKLVTTAAEITEMALRIAGAGHVVGMTEAEIVSFSAAISSVGIQAEAGGTAISQAMINMSEAVKTGNERLGTFALVAGTSVDEFSRLFRTDATQAIVAFVNGLNKMHDSGEDVFGVLDQLGLDGARMTRVMLGLSGAGDLINKSLEIGKNAWKNNTALVEQAEKRYETFWKQLKTTWNIINDILITVGQEMIPVIKDLNDSLKEVLGNLKKEEIISALTNITKAVGLAAAAFAAFKIGSLVIGFGQLLQTVGTLTISMTGLATASTAAATAAKAAALSFGIGTVALAALAAVIATAVTGWQAYTAAQEEAATVDALEESTNRLTVSLARQVKELRLMGKVTDEESDRLINALGKATASGDIDLQLRANRAVRDAIREKASAEVQFVNTAKLGGQIVSDASFDIEKMTKKFAEMNREAAKTVAIVDPTRMSSTTATKSIDEQFSQMFGEGAKVGESHFVKLAGEDPTAHIREMQVDQKNAQARLAFLETVGAQEVRITDETNQKKLELMKAYNEQLRALQLAQAAIVFQASQQIFGDLATITKEFAGEQAGVYKAMFAASKAFAIAEATVKIAQGIAQAAATGTTWVEKLVAIASVTAATASIVSNIRSVQLEFGGERALGGPVGAGKAFLVGERGQEMFVPNSAGNIIPNDDLRGMGSNVRVEINNFTDGTASVTERDDNGERVIEVTIQRTKREIASEIRDGRGEVSRAMESSFGLRRGK